MVNKLINKEIKQLSKVIRSFGEGMSPEELIHAKKDDLAIHIINAGYRKSQNHEVNVIIK